MRPKYSKLRKRAEFTVEERKLTLELLRQARKLSDPVYVIGAAGFWLHKRPPHFLRTSA